MALDPLQPRSQERSVRFLSQRAWFSRRRNRKSRGHRQKHRYTSGHRRASLKQAQLADQAERLRRGRGSSAPRHGTGAHRSRTHRGSGAIRRQTRASGGKRRTVRPSAKAGAQPSPRVAFAEARVNIENHRNLEQARGLLQEYLHASLTPDDPPRKEAEKLLRRAGG